MSIRQHQGDNSIQASPFIPKTNDMIELKEIKAGFNSSSVKLIESKAPDRGGAINEDKIQEEELPDQDPEEQPEVFKEIDLEKERDDKAYEKVKQRKEKNILIYLIIVHLLGIQSAGNFSNMFKHMACYGRTIVVLMWILNVINSICFLLFAIGKKNYLLNIGVGIQIYTCLIAMMFLGSES